jgi:Cation efflux family
MGHSHGHNHNHNKEVQEGRVSPKTTPSTTTTTTTTKWIRRLALWMCCWMATCGVTLIQQQFNKKPPFLLMQDWMAFGVFSLLVSSAPKIRRAMAQSVSRFQKFKEGVAKHSSFAPAASTSTSSGTGTAVSTAAAAIYRNNNNNNINIINTQEADRVTWMGVIINLLLSIAKLVVGIAQHSSVLIADAGHSLSDLVSDFITLWSVNVARLPPDEDHPYGHYKFEAIGSLFLSLTLLMTGVSVGLHSQQQFLLHILKTTTTTTTTPSATAASATNIASPGPLALLVAGISIFSKEWLFRVTKVVGEKINSPVVIANAWHHRSDAYSSVLALLSIAWSMVS